ncbi:MAG: SPOR domain-containing protein [Chitinophagales bacterium]
MSSTTIEVAKYIHDLLYEYSSVIVPDLGAFSTRNKMAAINEDDQTISPPIKTVVFNEKLKVNDGILVGHIAKMESIPPSLVEEALKKFAAQTKATLQAGEAVSLGNLGTLQDEGDKGVQFYPTQDLNLSLNSFGFKTLDLPVITATTPPNSNENIGAAGIGGTSELDLSSFEEEKDLPEEEEIPDTPSEKRTVSSVLAENAQNLPPVIPPEKRRKSGGGWFWLLPILIFGLCGMLIMQLQKEDNKGMANNETKTESEESSGLWSIPPFSWFAGDSDKEGELADKGNNNNTGGTNSSTSNQNNGANGNNNSDTEANDKGTVEAGGTGNKTGQDSNTDNNENTAANNGDADKASSGGAADKNAGNNNNTDKPTAKTNTDDKAGTTSSESANTDAKTSTTNNTNTNANNSGSTALTNTAALNGINIAKARAGEYAASSSPKGYYIIVGAFKSEANANKAINKLKGKGYDAHALKTTSGYYRVGIYGSTNGNTAKERYNKARANENKKAWLLNFN